MTGLEKFGNLLYAAWRPLLLRSITDRRDDWARSDLNLWFSIDAPTTITVDFNPCELFIWRIADQFREIPETLEVLHDIELYARAFPHRSRKLSKVRHLRYHCDNYLQETYLLKNRLCGFARRLERLYRADSRHCSIKASVDNLIDILKKGFDPILKMRGHQVHDARLRDKSHQALTSLEFYSGILDDDQFGEIFDDQYTTLRAERVAEIRSSNQSLDSIVDWYCNSLIPIVFDANEDLIFPSDVVSA